MFFKTILYLPLLLLSFSASSQQINLPDSVTPPPQGQFHMQGAAVDQKNKCIYFSFTDRLIKTDLSGRLIGSVKGLIGHLGDLTLGPGGQVYGSLEYKNDAIGTGIKKGLGVDSSQPDGFYVAIFNGPEITRTDHSAEEENILTTVYIKEAVLDYNATVQAGNKLLPHRFACSGIDGITFAPGLGSERKKEFLYIAYGIYGDNERTDNDYQVILKYDVKNWDRYARPLKQNKLNQSGPEKPLEKYFLKTGNTRYGIQNLAYDAHSGNLYAAVYRGSKNIYPNYDLFVIDGKASPKNLLVGIDAKKQQVKELSLVKAGIRDDNTGLSGWYFKWGSTGLCPLGNGEFYISHNAKTAAGSQTTTLYRYKWTGDARSPFEPLK